MASAVSVMMLLGFLLVGRVVDGDTFDDVNNTRWRLWGGDALEIRQWCNGRACGENARDALIEIIGGRDVVCESRGKSHDRIVGQCFVGDTDLMREMIRQGWAFDEPDFSNGKYSTDEVYARDHKRGMWAMAGVVRPSEWRKRNR